MLQTPTTVSDNGWRPSAGWNPLDRSGFVSVLNLLLLRAKSSHHPTTVQIRDRGRWRARRRTVERPTLAKREYAVARGQRVGEPPTSPARFERYPMSRRDCCQ